MARHFPSPSAHHGENPVLNRILKHTAAATGEAFFTALVQQMAVEMKTRAAWVTELLTSRSQLRTLAFYADGQMVNEMIIDIEGTPCGDVIEKAGWIHFEDDILAHYPDNHTLKAFKAASYMGVPLWDTDHRVMGHLGSLRPEWRNVRQAAIPGGHPPKCRPECHRHHRCRLR